jgi:hypothetical protein
MTYGNVPNIGSGRSLARLMMKVTGQWEPCVSFSIAMWVALVAAHALNLRAIPNRTTRTILSTSRTTSTECRFESGEQSTELAFLVDHCMNFSGWSRRSLMREMNISAMRSAFK